MDLEDWSGRWQNDQIGFHQPEVSGFLTKYAEQAWGAGPVGRVFVPLCGKSLDMVFLAERANTVIGVEYVEQAVQDFFVEQGLLPEVTGEGPRRFTSGKYTLFAADFYAMTNDHIGSIDAVFDRASLVALDPTTRKKYANHMSSLLRPGAEVLLVTFDYDQTQMNGPPFAVSGEDVNRLYQDDFTVEHLETRDSLDAMFQTRGLDAMTESVFLLTRT